MLLLSLPASFTAKHWGHVGGCGQTPLHHLLCRRKLLRGTRRKGEEDLGLCFAFASTVLTPLCLGDWAEPWLSRAEPPYPQPNAQRVRGTAKDPQTCTWKLHSPSCTSACTSEGARGDCFSSSKSFHGQEVLCTPGWKDTGLQGWGETQHFLANMLSGQVRN